VRGLGVMLVLGDGVVRWVSVEGCRAWGVVMSGLELAFR
jgi:hypothetical protein